MVHWYERLGFARPPFCRVETEVLGFELTKLGRICGRAAERLGQLPVTGGRMNRAHRAFWQRVLATVAQDAAIDAILRLDGDPTPYVYAHVERLTYRDPNVKVTIKPWPPEDLP